MRSAAALRPMRIPRNSQHPDCGCLQTNACQLLVRSLVAPLRPEPRLGVHVGEATACLPVVSSTNPRRARGRSTSRSAQPPSRAFSCSLQPPRPSNNTKIEFDSLTTPVRHDVATDPAPADEEEMSAETKFSGLSHTLVPRHCGRCAPAACEANRSLHSPAAAPRPTRHPPVNQPARASRKYKIQSLLAMRRGHE